MINLQITNKEAALIDAALSLFHQQMVSNIGSIKETMIEFGDEKEGKELLEGSLSVKNDTEKLLKRLEQFIVDDEKSSNSRIKKLKKR